MELHGGNIHKIKRENNIKEMLDYSANINPLGVPKSATKAFKNAEKALGAYPDPEYIDLRKAIGKYNNLDMENIIVGNGASELIFLLFKIMSGKRVLIVSPTFAEYERAAKINGCKVEFFPLKESENFEINLKRFENVLENGYDICVICNPNNPTSQLIPLEIMEKIYKMCTSLATLLFVDEAFIEFTDGGLKNSIINTSMDKKYLYVIRAFTKYFGMPGLRLGYAISFNKKITEKINNIKEPWSVNAFAEYAGISVLDDMKYIAESEKWICKEKESFYSELEKIIELKVYKPSANFILLKSKTKPAEEIYKEMLNKGIIIRRCSNFGYLDDTYFRIAIKGESDNKRMVQTLANIMKRG